VLYDIRSLTTVKVQTALLFVKPEPPQKSFEAAIKSDVSDSAGSPTTIILKIGTN
jgi:hypothetical protein